MRGLRAKEGRHLLRFICTASSVLHTSGTMQLSAPPRADAKMIFEAAVHSVSPEALVDRAISLNDEKSMTVAGQKFRVDQGVKLIAFGKVFSRCFTLSKSCRRLHPECLHLLHFVAMSMLRPGWASIACWPLELIVQFQNRQA
mmetsp:Transcript_20424/g.31925  ORF Transcript_20424/g.31925 Transcript_20424/m.31925 type:complete len:143 (-) Transcript_20424:123-551(-)